MKKEKIVIKAAEGRVPGFPESGNPIPHGQTFNITLTPQFKRMLKDGDIVRTDKPKEAKKPPLKKLKTTDEGGKEL